MMLTPYYFAHVKNPCVFYKRDKYEGFISFLVFYSSISNYLCSHLNIKCTSTKTLTLITLVEVHDENGVQ